MRTGRADVPEGACAESPGRRTTNPDMMACPGEEEPFQKTEKEALVYILAILGIEAAYVEAYVKHTM